MKRITIRISDKAVEFLKALAKEDRSSLATTAGKILESSPKMKGAK